PAGGGGRRACPAGARRWRTVGGVAASSIVVSSQDAGQNSRQFAAREAVSVTSWMLTPIWQLAVLPRVPEYWRATQGEAVPSLGKPEASTTHARGLIASAAPPATLARPLP